jgi:predicted nucleotidyltransferase
VRADFQRFKSTVVRIQHMMEEYNINRTTLKILGLYRSDYSRSLHLRQIARETNVDVKAVQLQLKRLEKMNILSSVRKGRNKEYSVNLQNAIAKYYLMLAETFASITYLARNFLVKKIATEISDRLEGATILFGSFAKEKSNKESDVDLFVINENKPGAPAKNAVRDVGDRVGREISLKHGTKRQFLEGLKEGDPLVREVVSSHVVLRGVDDFCDLMWRYHARQ